MKPRPQREPWVYGWGTQVILLALAGLAIWIKQPQQACTFVTGSAVIGVIRQLERERRAERRDGDGPTPGGKV